MASIHSYLTFSGNCREAMTFYQQCLGGELHFQTIGDSPMAAQIPPHLHPYILHATLTHDAWILMASDMVHEEGLKKGNALSMMLQLSSEAEIRTCYAALSTEGKATYPLEPTFGGAIFGGLTDKFGHQWLLNYDKNQPLIQSK